MSILPGHVRVLQSDEVGQLCEEGGCTNLAEIEVAGEVDSFGAEWHCMCRACHTKQKALPPTEADCDLCHTEAVLKPWRDWEEGNNGPVYYICQHCRARKNAYLKECMDEDDPIQDFEQVDDDAGYPDSPEDWVYDDEDC